MWSLNSWATFSISAFWTGTFIDFESKKGSECVCDNTAFLNDFCCSGLVFLNLSIPFCGVTWFWIIPSFYVKGLIWSLWKVNIAQPLGTFSVFINVAWFRNAEANISSWKGKAITGLGAFSQLHMWQFLQTDWKKPVMVYLCFLFKVVYVQVVKRYM